VNKVREELASGIQGGFGQGKGRGQIVLGEKAVERGAGQPISL
jgi:hypothetical protein